MNVWDGERWRSSNWSLYSGGSWFESRPGTGYHDWGFSCRVQPGVFRNDCILPHPSRFIYYHRTAFDSTWTR